MNKDIVIKYIRPEDALDLTQRSYVQVFDSYLRADQVDKPRIQRRLHRLLELSERIMLKIQNKSKQEEK